MKASKAHSRSIVELGSLFRKLTSYDAHGSDTPTGFRPKARGWRARDYPGINDCSVEQASVRCRFHAGPNRSDSTGQEIAQALCRREITGCRRLPVFPIRCDHVESELRSHACENPAQTRSPGSSLALQPGALGRHPLQGKSERVRLANRQRGATESQLG